MAETELNGRNRTDTKRYGTSILRLYNKDQIPEATALKQVGIVGNNSPGILYIVEIRLRYSKSVEKALVQVSSAAWPFPLFIEPVELSTIGSCRGEHPVIFRLPGEPALFPKGQNISLDIETPSGVPVTAGDIQCTLVCKHKKK